ncbi:MAG TPA: pantetheine-phosphate adenylyltransferase, partial [Pseudomonadota bacterium]|nr:pantetheine-phosphate adenylyltransferase [Pseudomonadota bacterium]
SIPVLCGGAALNRAYVEGPLASSYRGGEVYYGVDAFSGLLVTYVKERGARFVVRGLRALADFEYEFQFAHMNHRLAPDVDTIFLMTAAQYFYVSSSLVKEVAQFGGDVTWMVPSGIPQALLERLGAQPKLPSSA